MDEVGTYRQRLLELITNHRLLSHARTRKISFWPPRSVGGGGGKPDGKRGEGGIETSVLGYDDLARPSRGYLPSHQHEFQFTFLGDYPNGVFSKTSIVSLVPSIVPSPSHGGVHPKTA